MNTLSRIVLGLVIAIGGAAISMGAFATTIHGPGYTKRTMTVKYNDLNLASRAGVNTLFDRLVMAGHDVCGALPGFDPVELSQQWQSWRSCYDHALDNAAASIGNKRLSRMVDRNTGYRPGSSTANG